MPAASPLQGTISAISSTRGCAIITCSIRRPGYPQSLCRSVTIVAPTAALTDSLATGIFILGPEKGLAVLEQLGMGGIIVDKDGRIRMTEGLKDKVQLIGEQ